MTPLDRPVWHSLTTVQKHLAVGDCLARRHAPDVNMFASARDHSDAAIERLGELINPGETVYLFQAPPNIIPYGLVVEKEALGVQLVCNGNPPKCEDAGDIEKLTDADAGDMLALATLTKPGPFLKRTHTMGDFYGIRVDGRLAAMAGQRMRLPGHVEVSGVCTNPVFRGRGYAKRLSSHVANAIREAGDIPFLHAWKTNDAAIKLYESLGFAQRTDFHAAVVTRR